MLKAFKTLLSVAAFVLVVSVVTFLLGRGPESVAASHEKWESYDQENLKKGDSGCPTAVFVAPHGELIQCQVTFFPGFIPKSVMAPPEFDTAELAAVAGFKAVAAKPTATVYEWGGVVVKFPDGKFSALTANTDYSGDSVGIRGNAFGLNAEVVGTYHTHPCLPQHDVEFFSPQDLQEAIYFHKLVFMGDFCSGNVHEFVPGDKPDTDKAHDADMYLTKGRIIGQFTAPHALTVAE